MTLSWLPNRFVIARLKSGDPIPSTAFTGDFFSITKSPEEISVVCEEGRLDPTIRAETGWLAIKVAGPMSLSSVGVLASLVKPLADEGVSVFAISTFDTDYLLIQEKIATKTQSILQGEGHKFIQP